MLTLTQRRYRPQGKIFAKFAGELDVTEILITYLWETYPKILHFFGIGEIWSLFKTLFYTPQKGLLGVLSEG